jgi:hypothetical protein
MVFLELAQNPLGDSAGNGLSEDEIVDETKVICGSEHCK